MNDDAMLLLSYILELLFLFSLAIAVWALWGNLRARRSGKKDPAGRPPNPGEKAREE